MGFEPMKVTTGDTHRSVKLYGINAGLVKPITRVASGLYIKFGNYNGNADEKNNRQKVDNNFHFVAKSVNYYRRVCKWLKHADCKSVLLNGFEGSNPSSSTINL
jgi:hypothetical protein